MLPAAAAPTAGAAAGNGQPERLQAFAAAESDLLNAFLARLIPTDACGPGASEARVGRYIDQALAGDEKALAPLFASGLAAIDEYAQAAYGAVFVSLSPQAQDSVLADLDSGKPATFPAPGAAAFFGLLREYALQGLFCDPEQGGNANFIGWDLIGYPGVRMVWSRRNQSDIRLNPAHRSAGDIPLFKPNVPAAVHHGH
jgi:gluconate 2-dehydrogenase gamma chain